MEKSSSKTPKTAKLKTFKLNRETACFVIFVMAWAALSMIASQFVVAYPMVLLLGDAVDQPLWTLVYYIINYTITLALILFIPPRLWQVLRRNHPQIAKKSTKAETTATKSSDVENPLTTTPSEVGFGAAPTFVDIGLAPVGYIVYMFFASVLTSIMSVFTWFNAEQSQDVGFSYFITTSDRIFAMLAIVFIAPIAEEIIMRGWLYGKLRSKLGVLASMILVSILFGAMHGQWNVAVSTFALSLVLCGLREVTGTIWSSILLHMLSNGIAFYLLYVVGL